MTEKAVAQIQYDTNTCFFCGASLLKAPSTEGTGNYWSDGYLVLVKDDFHSACNSCGPAKFKEAREKERASKKLR
jgi:hypothetical protein